jgi:hypothetical protein
VGENDDENGPPFSSQQWREVKTRISVEAPLPSSSSSGPITVTLHSRKSANKTCIQIRPHETSLVYTVDALLTQYDQVSSTHPIRLRLRMALHALEFPDLHAFCQAFLTYESRSVLGSTASRDDADAEEAHPQDPPGDTEKSSGDPDKHAA